MTWDGASELVALDRDGIFGEQLEDKRISTRSTDLSTPIEPRDDPESLLRGKTIDRNVLPAHQHVPHTSQDSANSEITPNKPNPQSATDKLAGMLGIQKTAKLSA